MKTAIAIIGMSCRFPGAKNIDEYWSNLCQGKESITFFSDEELIQCGISPDLLAMPNYIKAKGYLDRAEFFDAEFFGTSPIDAQTMDPQHRIFLEAVWEALENSGYYTEEQAGKISVIAGVSGLSSNGYYQRNLANNVEINKTVGAYQLNINNGSDFLSTRAAYKFNFTGPSYTVQAGCSTSLIAISQACQSLLNYQCDMAIAGAVTLDSPLKSGYLYQPGMILSPDGHCRAFDADAAGTVPGNGVGIVVLKRLDEAVASQDHIYAVIKGFALNNDGAQKMGYTAPSSRGQAEVIAEAMAVADVNPESITYIEAHGTGTKQGDPIEIAGLTEAFGLSTNKTQFCAMGSVKTNIGHLDASSGVAGLIKTALSLYHKKIPPTLHFKHANSEIDFTETPFFINTKLVDWQTSHTHSHPRRAGVSSFGIGGTNAHIVLEEAPARMRNTAQNEYWFNIPLSAKSTQSLEEFQIKLANHLMNNPELSVADVAHTLQLNRKNFNYRSVSIVKNINDLIDSLTTKSSKNLFSNSSEIANNLEIVMMFPGQGEQYVNMGLDLYLSQKVFREQLDHCALLLIPEIEIDIRTLLYPELFNKNDSEFSTLKSLLVSTRYTQPALFAIEYALTATCMDLGIKPHTVIGHSLGEYVAACVAGIFSLEDALKLVSIRGQLMDQLPDGAMLAVSLSEEKIQKYLNDDMCLAAINGTSHCIVSASIVNIVELEQTLKQNAVACVRLASSKAFHSKAMQPIVESFFNELKKIKLNPPQLPLISNLTGRPITNEEATNPDYWCQHIVSTVRFAKGLEFLSNNPHHLFLEVGPGNLLSSFAKKYCQPANRSRIIHLVDKAANDAEGFMFNRAIGLLWAHGVEINWKNLNNLSTQHIPLPTYAFAHKKYWLDSQSISVEPENHRLETSAAISKHFDTNLLASVFNNIKGNALIDLVCEKKLYAEYLNALNCIQNYLSKPKVKETKQFKANDPIEQITTTIANIFGKHLGIDSIDPSESFFALGGDSLAANQTILAIQEAFAINCDIHAVFHFPKAIDLAAHLYPKIVATKPENKDHVKPSNHELSSVQQRMLFLESYEPGIYNIPIAIQLTGDLNINVLEKCFNEVIKRHAGLRTVFKFNEYDKAEQIILDEYQIDLQLESLEQDQVISKLITEAHQIFDLNNGPLFKVKIFRIDTDNHILFINQHHIISDGWSISVIFNQINTLYRDYLLGKEPNQNQDFPCISEFSMWQSQFLKTAAYQQQLQYWKKTLANLQALNLPTDFQRPKIEKHDGDNFFIDLGVELGNQLKELGNRHNATFFMVLYSGLALLIHKYCKQEDIVIGTAIANRTQTQFKNLVGFLANTLTIRSLINDDLSYIEFLSRIKTNCLNAYENQDVAFDKLVELLEVERDTSKNPIFQIMLLLENQKVNTGLDLPNIYSENIANIYKVSQFDLTFHVCESASGLNCRIEYNTHLFSATTIRNLAERFKVILKHIIQHADEKIKAFPIITPDETKQLLSDWNNTADFSVINKPLHQIFQEQAKKYAYEIAVIFESQSLSYQELDRKSNQLAHAIRDHFSKNYQQQISENQLIGIYLPRSLEMIVTILGILKAGAAYVALNIAHPPSRLEEIIYDAKLSFIISNRNFKSDHAILQQRAHTVIAIEDISDYSEDAICNINNLNSLAYVIYTSGSTGVPKGVLIKHAGVVSLLQDIKRKLSLSKDNYLISLTSISFDISVLEIFLPLISGAKLCFLSTAETKDPFIIVSYIQQYPQAIVQATPSTWSMIADLIDPINSSITTLVGGEPLTENLAKKLLQFSKRVWNVYGPTETTIWSTYHEIKHNEEFATIGRGFANTFLYVLDSNLNLLPINVPGDLYISGIALAQGYLNKPDLTNTAFISNPYKTCDLDAILYKTGDVVRWNHGGALEYIGRKDNQIKIRGHRIELKEIEDVLNKCPSINQAVCIAISQNEQTQLVAYYTALPEFLIPQEKEQELRIRDYLLTCLPDYMIPSLFMQLQQFPLTSNGKIDRKQLPLPQTNFTNSVAVHLAPTTIHEKMMVELWADILKNDRLIIDANLFSFGVNSLLIAQAYTRLVKQGYPINITDFFQYPTIQSFAKKLDELNHSAALIDTPTAEGSQRRRINKIYTQRQKAKNIQNYLEDDLNV